MPIYMKIEGLEGESRAEHYRGWFDLYSYSWGESNQGVRGGGGGGSTGRVEMSDFAVSKPCGKSSTKLFLFCANGRHLPAVQFEVTLYAGDREVVLQRFSLEDCMITSFQTSGDGDSRPSESVSFNFTKITFMQAVIDESGQVETETAWWDLRRNRGG